MKMNVTSFFIVDIEDAAGVRSQKEFARSNGVEKN